MKGKRHSPEQIVRKLREADRLLAEGADVDAVCRHLEVSVQPVVAVRRPSANAPVHASSAPSPPTAELAPKMMPSRGCGVTSARTSESATRAAALPLQHQDRASGGLRLNDAALGDLELTHLELLDFAGNGHRKGVDEANKLRDLVASDLSRAVGL